MREGKYGTEIPPAMADDQEEKEGEQCLRCSSVVEVFPFPVLGSVHQSCFII